MNRKFALITVALLAVSAVTQAATLTYEVTGQLDQGTLGPPWPSGTSYIVRFSYASDSLQVAEIYGDFPAPAVVARGDLFLDSNLVLSFTDKLIWRSADSLPPTFILDLEMNPGTNQPLNPTVTPADSNLFVSLAFAHGFLPDGRLFDDSVPSSSSVLGRMSFDYRSSPGAFGGGDIALIRLVPETGTAVLGLIGLFAWAFLRRWAVPTHRPSHLR